MEESNIGAVGPDGMQQGFADRNLNPFPGDGRTAVAAVRTADAPRAIHAKIIIILLACILAVGIAGLVFQVISPIGMTITRGGDPQFIQSPPTGATSGDSTSNSGGSTMYGTPPNTSTQGRQTT
jgi:predicted phage tail protein